MAPLNENESISQFEQRKVDHIHLSLDSRNQTPHLSHFSSIELIHEALPDLNFDEVRIETTSLGFDLKTPFLVSSMTAGHVGGMDLNQRLAVACEQRGWMMGVGSQRRELSDPEAQNEWKNLRRRASKVRLLGNIGLSQLISISDDQVQRLVDSLEASAMIVHLNPLQECLQPEGTPQFRGGLERITKLAGALKVPVVVKETGCGFSKATIQRLQDSGIQALDVSGLGGTHWGRIEGGRAGDNDKLAKASQTFANWGISTVESLMNAQELNPKFEVWASGGVRSGLDAAKMLALGSQVVGFAKPILEAALQSEKSLNDLMERLEFELKVALFCTGSKDLKELKAKKVWRWLTK